MRLKLGSKLRLRYLEIDMILERVKDFECDKELVAKELLEAEEHLNAEEQLEHEDELVAKKEYGKYVILTSLVLIHDHQMCMCLICILFPSFLVLSQWVFQREVFSEANVSHSNHSFADQDHDITFINRSIEIYIKPNPIYAHYKVDDQVNYKVIYAHYKVN